MEIERFSTGRVRPKAASRGPRRYLPGGWSDETLPVNVVPRAPSRRGSASSTRARRPGGGAGLPPSGGIRSCGWRASSLARGRDRRAARGPRDRCRRSVRWVVLSHLHTDHVGGIGAFPDAEVIVSRRRVGARPGAVRTAARLRAPALAARRAGARRPERAAGRAVPGLVRRRRRRAARRRARRPATRPGTCRWSSGRGGGGAFLGGDIAHTPAELPRRSRTSAPHERLTVLLAHDG